jgi:CheY-like chemotaxis protein
MMEQRGAEDPTFGLFSISERLAYVGGAMHIESIPGQGTRVTLSVPGTAAPNRPAPEPLDERARSSIRVLVAEDNRALRRMLIARLNGEQGIEVVADTADGQSAVRLACEHEPDVVVMDVRLPGLEGPEATRRLRQQCPGVRVIGHTAHARGDHAESMRQGGAVACVQKDSSCRELIAAIQDAMNASGRHDEPMGRPVDV